MKFPGKVDNGPMNSWLNFGGDRDHRLDTGIVFRIRYHYEIGKAGLCCNYDVITSPAQDSNYDVITSLALDGGMHCHSAFILISYGKMSENLSSKKDCNWVLQ